MTKEIAKIKLCIFINGFGGGGAEKQCAYLINELKKDNRFELSLIYFFEGINFKLVDNDNLRVYKIPSTSLYSFKNIPLIIRIIKQINPNIIYSWMHAPDVYSFFIKTRFPKIKWVIAERNSRYAFWNFRFILRVALARFSDKIICNSPQGKEYWLKKGIRGKKLIVVPNILYINYDFPASNPIQLGNPTVLFAGRLEPQKNVIVLTNAFCQLADKYQDGRFYIIGEGSLKEDIMALIDSFKKAQEINILPFQKNIQSYFNCADVFVNISTYEGLPNTVIENIALNKKIVVSGIPQHKDVLGNAYPYYVNDLTNPSEVALKIEQAFKEKHSTDELNFGKKRLNDMTPERVISTYKRLFTDIYEG